MKYSKLIVLVGLVVLVVFAGYLLLNSKETESFEEKRIKIISDMESTLSQATLSGDYRCCIEPACKMCFLGNWSFEDGKCDCDRFIAQGEWDKVCPECVHGIEKGECESVGLGTCSVDI